MPWVDVQLAGGKFCQCASFTLLFLMVHFMTCTYTYNIQERTKHNDTTYRFSILLDTICAFCANKICVCVSVHHSIYMESESAKYCVRQIWCQFCRFKFIYFHGTCISFSYYRYWSIYLTSLFKIKSIDAKPYLFTHNSKCETHGRNPFLTHISTIFIEPHFSFHLCQIYLHDKKYLSIWSIQYLTIPTSINHATSQPKQAANQQTKIMEKKVIYGIYRCGL